MPKEIRRPAGVDPKVLLAAGEGDIELLVTYAECVQLLVAVREAIAVERRQVITEPRTGGELEVLEELVRKISLAIGLV